MSAETITVPRDDLERAQSLCYCLDDALKFLANNPPDKNGSVLTTLLEALAKNAAEAGEIIEKAISNAD